MKSKAIKKPKAKTPKPEVIPEYKFCCYDCGTYFTSPATGYARCTSCGSEGIQVAEKPVENVPKNNGSRTRGLKPFEPGCPPGPGRPPGVRSARDIYSHVGNMVTPKIILDKLAESGIKPSQKELDDVIAYAAAVRAAAGNNGALKEYNDRRFGRSEQNINAKVFQVDANTMSEEVKDIAKRLGLIDLT